MNRLLLLLCTTCLLLVAGAVQAERSHRVQNGQNLARIAARYHVSVQDLASANGLARDATLRPGMTLTIPARGTVYVRRGDTLARIARHHRVAAADLARQNHLKPDQPLRIGQRLVLPGFEAAAEQQQAAHRWGRPKRPGWVTFYRVRTQEKQRIRVLDSRGRVRRGAQTQLRHLLRPMNSRRRRDPHPRLLRLLAQTSDHFGGRTLHVVSGLRLPGGYTKESSRHTAGHAVDFRVQGVPLRALHEYCLRFSKVGVGLYPRSGFVHLDVRRDDARWVDYSLPGQAPQLKRPGAAADPEAAEAAEGSQPMDDGEPPADDGADELSDE